MEVEEVASFSVMAASYSGRGTFRSLPWGLRERTKEALFLGLSTFQFSVRALEE